MLAACPDCQAPYAGNPPTRKAARVCKACGHAFLLHPDGTVESLKKEAPKPSEPEPVAATVEAVVNAAALDTPPASEPLPAPDMPGNDAPPSITPAASAPGDFVMSGPSPFGEASGQPAMAPTPWSAPPPGPPAPMAAPAGSDADDKPASKPSRALVALLPVMLIVGGGIGFAASIFLAPKPPPPPAPVVENKPKPVPPTEMFISADEPLWAGPSSTGAYPQVAVLPKGSSVLATTAEVEAFVLVRDAMGRAGFVRSFALTAKRPSGAFVDCARAPFEADASVCQARATQQLEVCKGACTDAACADACQKSATDCTAACAQVGTLTGAPAAAAAPPPVAEEPAPKKGKRKAKKRGPTKSNDKGGGPAIPLPEPE